MGDTPKPLTGENSPAPLIERPLGFVASPSLIKEGDKGEFVPAVSKFKMNENPAVVLVVLLQTVIQLLYLRLHQEA